MLKLNQEGSFARQLGKKPQHLKVHCNANQNAYYGPALQTNPSMVYSQSLSNARCAYMPNERRFNRQSRSPSKREYFLSSQGYTANQIWKQGQLKPVIHCSSQPTLLDKRELSLNKSIYFSQTSCTKGNLPTHGHTRRKDQLSHCKQRSQSQSHNNRLFGELATKLKKPKPVQRTIQEKQNQARSQYYSQLLNTKEQSCSGVTGCQSKEKQNQNIDPNIRVAKPQVFPSVSKQYFDLVRTSGCDLNLSLKKSGELNMRPYLQGN